MFGFGKKKDDQDPKKALQNASDALNNGLMGGLTKAFMGKNFVNKMNTMIEKGNESVNTSGVSQSGTEAEAEVLFVQETGVAINTNAMVMIGLKVTPSFGEEFQTATQVMLARVSIPKVGDRIKIKYNPANLSQIVIL